MEVKGSKTLLDMKKIKRFRLTAFKRVCHSLQVPRLNPLNMLSRKIFLKSFIEKSDQYKELFLPGSTSAHCVRESCTHRIFGWVTRWGLFAPMRFPFPTCFHREKCFRLSWAHPSLTKLIRVYKDGAKGMKKAALVI